MSKQKHSSKRTTKKQVLKKVAKTIKAKSGKTKSRGKSVPKRANVSKRQSRIRPAKPLLSIAYNGVGAEFVFQLTNRNGQVSQEYHVSGSHIINTMGVPIMVTPRTT